MFEICPSKLSCCLYREAHQNIPGTEPFEKTDAKIPLLAEFEVEHVGASGVCCRRGVETILSISKTFRKLQIAIFYL